ncbi:MAG: hypothetical protein ACFCBV_04445 [Phycisphaerales bacterium]
MPPTLEQDIQAMLAEADPARRRLLAAKMIDTGGLTGMTRGQADEIVGLLAQRDTIPFDQAKAEIGQVWQGLQTQTPVRAGERTLGRATQRGAMVQQAQLDAAMRGGGVQLPEPYYDGPPEGREAYMRRFYAAQGANEQGMIPRQDGSFAASLLGTEGGQAWYTDPTGTAVAVAGGLGVEPGASAGYNLSRAMEGDPAWQTPERASATAMRNQMAAGPVQFIRQAQAENMAGSIAGTLGGYAGAAAAGGRAGLRATAGLGRGGARTAARAGGAVAGENLAIGAQAGLLEAGRTLDQDSAARAGFQATTPGIVATVGAKLARGQAVAPMEWADLGLSLGFDGVSVFQAIRAVGVPDGVARQAAEQAVAAQALLPPGQRITDPARMLPPAEPGRAADGGPRFVADRSFVTGLEGQTRMEPRLRERAVDAVGETGVGRQADEFSIAQELGQLEEADASLRGELRAAQVGDRMGEGLREVARKEDPFYGVRDQVQSLADRTMRDLGPSRHSERMKVTRLAIRQEFPQLGNKSVTQIVKQAARAVDADMVRAAGTEGPQIRPATPGQLEAQRVAETGVVREAGATPQQWPDRGRTEPFVDAHTRQRVAFRPEVSAGERLSIPTGRPGAVRPEASLTRSQIDERLVSTAEQRGLFRSNEDFAAQFRGEAEIDTKFSGNMPTELREALEGRPHLRTMIRTRVPRGTGEDSLASLGTDRFIEMLEAQQGNSVRQAMDALDGDPDPEVSWLVAAREPVGLGDRLSEVQASSLAEGNQFRLGSSEYTVVRRDGELAAIDAQGNVREIAGYQRVPMSAGSLREGGERVARQAIQRAEQLEAEPIPFGDDATPVARPNFESRTVRASQADMESAGFEKVAEHNSQQAAVAYAKRQDRDGGPRHVVIKDGGKHRVMRGGAAPTVLVMMGLGAVAKGISDAQRPEEAEAAIEAASIAGDIDLADPYVWVVLAAAALVGVGPVAKRLGVNAPGQRVATQAVQGAERATREILDAYSGPLIDRLAAKGKDKPVTTAFVDKARAATDEANKATRGWQAAIIDPLARRMHGPASIVRGRRARAELMHEVKVADVDGVEAFETMGQKLIEGLEPVEAFNKLALEYKEAHSKLYRETGKHMEDAGIQVEVIGEDGKPTLVPFKQQGQPVWLRHLSPDLVRALKEGGDYGRAVKTAVSKVIAKLNTNEDAPVEWDRITKAIEETYDGGEVSTARIIRTTNAEHLRTIERMPAIIRFEYDGKMQTIHLLDTDPIRQLTQMASKAASRSAVARHVGYERATLYGKERSIAALRASILDESGEAGAALFDETMRSLSSLPLAQHLKYQARPGSATYEGQRIMRSVFGLARTFGLSASPVVNVPEPLGLPRALFGTSRFARALVDLGTSQRWGRNLLVEELHRDGAITRDRLPWYGLTRPKTEGDTLGNTVIFFESAARTAAQFVGTPHRLSNEWGEIISSASARQMVTDLKGGRATGMDRVRLRLLNFNDTQVECLLSGRAPDALYNAVQIRAAQRAVGANAQPHELSKAGNDPLYRSVVWYDAYTQMITNRAGRALGHMLSAPRGEKRAAALLAADLGIGGAMAGLSGIALRAMFFGGITGLAVEWRRAEQELSGDDGTAGVTRFFARIFEAYFGGPMYAVLGSAFDDGLTPGDLGTALSSVRAGTDLWNLLSGQGPFAHLPLHEKVDLYLRRGTPMYRGGGEWVAAYGLGDDNPAYDAVKREVYRYLREQGLMTTGEFGQAEAFTVGMRRARREIMAGDYEKARQTMIEAATSESRSWDQVRASLRGMRILPRIPLKDRAKHLQAIRARLGEDGYARVLMHDRMLEAMAR